MIDLNEFTDDRKFHGREVAIRLKVSRSYLTKLIKQANLTIKKKGREYIYTVGDVEELQYFLNRKKRLKKKRIAKKKTLNNLSIFFDFKEFAGTRFSNYKSEKQDPSNCIYSQGIKCLIKIGSN